MSYDLIIAYCIFWKADKISHKESRTTRVKRKAKWWQSCTSNLAPTGQTIGERNGNPLQYPCLGNPMDRRAWQATLSTLLKRVRYNWSNLARSDNMMKLVLLFNYLCIHAFIIGNFHWLFILWEIITLFSFCFDIIFYMKFVL